MTGTGQGEGGGVLRPLWEVPWRSPALGWWRASEHQSGAQQQDGARSSGEELCPPGHLRKLLVRARTCPQALAPDAQSSSRSWAAGPGPRQCLPVSLQNGNSGFTPRPALPGPGVAWGFLIPAHSSPQQCDELIPYPSTSWREAGKDKQSGQLTPRQGPPAGASGLCPPLTSRWPAELHHGRALTQRPVLPVWIPALRLTARPRRSHAAGGPGPRLPHGATVSCKSGPRQSRRAGRACRRHWPNVWRWSDNGAGDNESGFSQLLGLCPRPHL